MSYKDWSVGVNLFTGDFTKDGDDYGITGNANHKDYLQFGKNMKSKTYYGGEYSGINASKYRMGAAYIGYKGYKFGRNSEQIRHLLQNKFAHTRMKYQPYFKVLDIQPQGYFQYHSYNQFTLW